VTKAPKLPLNDNIAGNAETAFGNSIGDRQMLEYDRLWRTGVIPLLTHL
jgi:hypothetical protein